MNGWNRTTMSPSAKTGWRARGFEDASAGRIKRVLNETPENVEAYADGFRIGKRERARAAQ